MGSRLSKQRPIRKANRAAQHQAAQASNGHDSKVSGAIRPGGSLMLYQGDCASILAADDFPTVDLVFTSPPYEDARQYGMDFDLAGQRWVNWAFERFVACVEK